MLSALHTKILLATLAAVLGISGILYHEHEARLRAAEAVRQHNAQTWEFVHKQHQRNNVNPAGGSKTWTHYLP